MSKADYVRSEVVKGHDGKHRCHAEGCDKFIAPAFLMCPRHWRMVPIAEQRAIWRHYSLAMSDIQNGLCAICGKSDMNKALAVDHCHSTGKVRGLLCSRCNPAIGFAGEDINLLRAMIAYLEKHKQPE